MVTYCRHMDISDINFITASISGYLLEKLSNGNIPGIFAYYSDCSKNKARKEINNNRDYVLSIIDTIAWEMSWHLKTRTVREHIHMVVPQERLVKEVQIIDGMSGKLRTLGLEKMIFQLYEVLARDASQELFDAKVGIFQVAAIKKKGQSFGKRYVERWMSRDPEGTKYCAKSDIAKCYPSMSHDVLRTMLHRDLGKSDMLLYLYDTILDLYKEAKEQNGETASTNVGIFIGSPVSKDLCNYYMSKLYHYICEQMYTTKTRRGKEIRTRYVSHVIMYMDDIVIFGGNKKYLQKAMHMIIDFCADVLRLTIKSDWKKFLLRYKNSAGKVVGNTLDFMGYVFCGYEVSLKKYENRIVKVKRVRTKIRDSIFIKSRRKMHRFSKKIKKRIQISEKYAMSTISYNGWVVTSDSFDFRVNEHWDQIISMAKHIVSRYAKEKAYAMDRYYQKWRKIYA